MRIQEFFKLFGHMLNAFRARYYSSSERKNYKKARACLDAAFSLDDDPFHYLLAYDANLMTLEGRHEEAIDRYRECLAALPEPLSSDETYVSLFCRLRLAIYDNRYYEELEELRQKAANLGVRRRGLKHFLPLISKSMLAEICDDRIPIELTFNLDDRPARTTRVHYGPSFKVR